MEYDAPATSDDETKDSEEDVMPAVEIVLPLAESVALFIVNTQFETVGKMIPSPPDATICVPLIAVTVTVLVVPVPRLIQNDPDDDSVALLKLIELAEKVPPMLMTGFVLYVV